MTNVYQSVQGSNDMVKEILCRNKIINPWRLSRIFDISITRSNALDITINNIEQ